MANLTLGGAIKVYLDGLALGATIYRDAPPEGTARPYITIHEDIALAIDGLEDGGSAGGGTGPSSSTGVEQVQMSLWLDLVQDQQGSTVDLKDRLTRVIHGARLPLAPTTVYGVIQRNRVRLPDELGMSTAYVQYAYTLDIFRQI